MKQKKKQVGKIDIYAKEYAKLNMEYVDYMQNA